MRATLNILLVTHMNVFAVSIRVPLDNLVEDATEVRPMIERTDVVVQENALNIGHIMTQSTSALSTSARIFSLVQLTR